MSNRLHLPKMAMRAALVAAGTISIFGQKARQAQSLPPVPAVSAAPTKYDFQWEIYTFNAAPSGKALYVFQGRQPVGIAALGADGKPNIFPIVSGAAADELDGSFKRYQKANGVGATPPPRTSATAPIDTSPPPTTSGGGAPRVAFDASGSHVLLAGGTRVDFLNGSIEVAMPAIIHGLPGTTVRFNSRVKGGTKEQALSETAITLNGKAIDWQRKGPVWDGLKDLVLAVALGKAAQAATIAGSTPRRPANAPDYVALVDDIENYLN